MTDLLDETDDDLPGLDEPSPKIWLYPFLAELGITRIEASMSGSGDSGDINDAVYYHGDEVISPEGRDVQLKTPDTGLVLTWFVSGGMIVREGDPICEVDPVEARELLSLCLEQISVLEELEQRQSQLSVLEELEQRQSQLSVLDEGGPDMAEVEKARTALAERIRWLETRTEALSTQIKERDPGLLPDQADPEKPGIGRQREALEGQIPGLEQRAALTRLTAPADGFVNTFDPAAAMRGFRSGDMLLTLTPLSHIETILSKLTLDDGTTSRVTFKDVLYGVFETDGSAAGNWYDNEGGSVSCSYDLSPELGRIRLIDADYSPGEEYGDEEEEDWEPELAEPEEEDDDVEP
jgi:hypothetical protein